MDTGGKIRTGKILEQLSRSFDITVISNVESPQDDKYVEKMNNLCSDFIAVPWKEVRKHTLRFYIKLFFQMFSRYPVNVLNDYSKDLKNTIKDCINKEKYDLLICDFLQSTLNFQGINGYPCILFQHNVESIITKRHVENAKNLITRFFWRLQWKKMLSFESKASKSFDTVIAVSDKDRESFQSLYNLDNIVTIPTGVDVCYYAPLRGNTVEENSLVFCGSMDWLPNEDAMLFFVKDILPLVKDKITGIRLTIVGRNPSQQLSRVLENYPEVELTGWVDDIRPYIAKSSLYIVPIRIGGGTRMKIFEAMAMGKTVLSTSVGAEGLPVTNEENILIEDDPTRYGEKIVELLENRRKREEISSAAYDLVCKYFTWKKVTDEFAKICQNTGLRNSNKTCKDLEIK